MAKIVVTPEMIESFFSYDESIRMPDDHDMVCAYCGARVATAIDEAGEPVCSAC